MESVDMSQNASILIAEDDAGHFALVKKNLWRTCALREIIHFRSGEELLRFLFPPEDADSGILNGHEYLVLLDIRLPGKNGIEILRLIKQDQELRKIPVFMLTTSSDPTDINRSYELGCSAYINKPRDYTDFMETVESIGQLLSMPEFIWPPIQREKIGCLGPS